MYLAQGNAKTEQNVENTFIIPCPDQTTKFFNQTANVAYMLPANWSIVSQSLYELWAIDFTRLTLLAQSSRFPHYLLLVELGNE